MRTLQLTFPAVAHSGRVLTMSARFLGIDADDGADGDEAAALPALITCCGHEFEPTEDGAYRARQGGTVLKARDPRYCWPQLLRLAELALGSAAH